MSLVELARYYNSLDAGLARSLLARECVESFLFDTEMTWEGMGGVIPVRLMVLAEDREEAALILALPVERAD